MSDPQWPPPPPSARRPDEPRPDEPRPDDSAPEAPCDPTGESPATGSQLPAPSPAWAQPPPGGWGRPPGQAGSPDTGRPQDQQPPQGYGPPPGYGQPQPGQASSGQPRYGQVAYGQPQYGQVAYGQPQYGQPQYGQPQYGQPQYGQPQPGPTGPTAGSWTSPGGSPAGGQGWSGGQGGGGGGQAPGGWSFGWGGPPPAAKPGIVPLRPLQLGEILDGAVQLIRKAPRLVLGLSTVVAVIGAVLTLVVQIGVLRDGFTSSLEGNSVGIGFSGTQIIAFVVTGLLQLVLAGMLTAVASDMVLGRTPTLASVWGRVRPMILALLVGASLATVLPYLALVTIVGGVFLWAALGLTTPALVLERLGPFAALRRSMQLVRPDFFRILGIRALAFVIAQVIGGVVTIPLAAAIGVLTVAGGVSETTAVTLLVILTGVASVLATALTAPFTAGVDALLYIDRRMRAEGLDIRLRDAAERSARDGAPGY